MTYTHPACFSLAASDISTMHVPAPILCICWVSCMVAEPVRFENVTPTIRNVSYTNTSSVY